MMYRVTSATDIKLRGLRIEIGESIRESLINYFGEYFEIDLIIENPPFIRVMNSNYTIIFKEVK